MIDEIQLEKEGERRYVVRRAGLRLGWVLGGRGRWSAERGGTTLGQRRTRSAAVSLLVAAAEAQ